MVVELDEKLLSAGAKKPLHFAPTLGFSGSTVHQANPQHGAGTQQLGVDERGPVIQVKEDVPITVEFRGDLRKRR